MSAPVLCIGGAVLDRTYRAHAPLIPGTSNPVTGTRGSGGVARNVAANLAGLGIPVRLLSAVGSEDEAYAMLAALEDAGVDTSLVLRLPEAATATYIAALNPDGGLAFGLADMGILDALTPERVLPALPPITGWIFADLNLPAATIAALIGAKQAGSRLAIDAVSRAKIARLPARLDGIDLLCLNRDEAHARRGADAPPEQQARALLDAGAGAVLLTLGAAGALVADAACAHILPAPSGPVASVTGAGDAAIAGTIAGLRRGWPLARAAAFGQRLAALTITVPDSVHPMLSPTLLEDA